VALAAARTAPTYGRRQGEEAIADPTRTVELIAIKDGWLATTADSRRAAYGTTKEAALAAWAQSEERATRLLKRYWRRFPGAVLATFERERSDGA
jgi:hypothetical protein